MENNIVNGCTMKTKLNNRIWEIDFLRGFAFFLMLIDHITFDIASPFFSYWVTNFSDSHPLVILGRSVQWFRSQDFVEVIRFIFISGIFLLVSGISANLSKSNFKRGVKLLIISIILSLITVIIAIITGQYNFIIYFGILHCLSVCMILTPVMKQIPKGILIIIGLAIIVVGIFLSKNNFHGHWLLLPFNFTPSFFVTGDYYPLFPFMGVYILGYVLGSYIYKEKCSLFNSDYNLPPFNYFGRNALWLYFVHQVVIIIFLVVATGLFMIIR